MSNCSQDCGVDQFGDQPVDAQRRLEATLRDDSWAARTPTTSVTAGRVSADPELARRVRIAARARATRAGAPDTDGADYVLGELLGAGGMGLVYSARQAALDRTVAVKVLRADRQDEAVRQEFLAEALVAADLDHPNTVPVYDIGLTGEGSLFYAMKLVRGTAWSRTLATNSLEHNLDILLKLCDVVSF